MPVMKKDESKKRPFDPSVNWPYPKDMESPPSSMRFYLVIGIVIVLVVVALVFGVTLLTHETRRGEAGQVPFQRTVMAVPAADFPGAPTIEFVNLPKAGKARLEFVDELVDSGDTRDYVCRPKE